MRRWPVLAGLLALVLPACTSAPPPAPVGALQAARGSSVVARTGAGRDPLDLFGASLHRAMPADLVRPATVPAGCPDAGAAAAQVAAEARRTGSTAWRAAGPSRPGGTAFYLDRTSVSCGDSVSVHLGGRGGPVRLEVWRMGWYGGAGGRLVERTPVVDAVPGTTAAPVEATRSPQLDWPVGLRLKVSPAWVPGVYLLVARPAHGPATWAPLVVRDDTGRAPLLVVLDDLTWAAYDAYGGRSLYAGRGRGPRASQARAYAVPLTRPMDGHDVREVQVMDLPVVRYAEQLGLPVAYTTDTALDATPSTLLRHAALVFAGHSEYWTRRMYDAVEAARNDGVNLAFLGANDAYWQARLGPPGDPTAGGEPVAADTTDAGSTSVVVFRDPALDPVARLRPDLTTVRWFAHPLRRDPAEMVGQSTSGVDVRGGEQVLDPGSWLLAGTGLRRRDVLRQVVGDETDGYRPGARTEPPGVDVVLVSAFRGAMGPELVSTTYYVAPSGAGVFSAGTTYWPCDLEAACPGPPVPAATRSAVRRITATVLEAFARRFAGRAHPARAVLPPRAAVLLTELAPGAAVTAGTATEQVPVVDAAPRAQRAPVPTTSRAATPTPRPVPATGRPRPATPAARPAPRPSTGTSGTPGTAPGTATGAPSPEPTPAVVSGARSPAPSPRASAGPSAPRA